MSETCVNIHIHIHMCEYPNLSDQITTHIHMYKWDPVFFRGLPSFYGCWLREYMLHMHQMRTRKSMCLRAEKTCGDIWIFGSPALC